MKRIRTVGFYRLIPFRIALSARMYVVFPVPAGSRELVYGRHWLRSGIPLLKEILGLQGDRVCIYANHSRSIDISWTVFAVDLEVIVTATTGCFEIQPGYFFAASSTSSAASTAIFWTAAAAILTVRRDARTSECRVGVQSHVDPATTFALIAVESAGRPYAIHETPLASRTTRLMSAGSPIRRHPDPCGHRVDLASCRSITKRGCGRLNCSQERLHPCTNIRLGTTILSANYPVRCSDRQRNRRLSGAH